MTRRLLGWRLAMRIEAARFDEARIPFNNGDGFFNAGDYAAETAVIRTEADAVAWIARLRGSRRIEHRHAQRVESESGGSAGEG